MHIFLNCLGDWGTARDWGNVRDRRGPQGDTNGTPGLGALEGTMRDHTQCNTTDLCFNVFQYLT